MNFCNWFDKENYFKFHLSKIFPPTRNSIFSLVCLYFFFNYFYYTLNFISKIICEFFSSLATFDYFTSCPTKIKSLKYLLFNPYRKSLLNSRLVISYWWKISWGTEILGYFSGLVKGRVRLKFMLEFLLYFCSDALLCSSVVYITTA